MMVRCERCRAVFRHATPLHATALECSRCHHVFSPPATELIALTPQGVLGGAAVIAASRPSAPAPAASALPVEQPARGSPLIVVALGVVVVVLAFVALRGPASTGRMSEGTLVLQKSEALVAPDDVASLEESIRTLSEASVDPDDVDLPAQRAFVMLLLGASLRQESDDLIAALSHAFNPEALAAMSEADRATAQQEGAAIRERLPVLTARSDDLIRDGLALARATERPGKERTAIQQRAFWFADAFDHRADRLQAPPASRGAGLAWWHIARAIAVGNADSAASRASMEKELTTAVAANPSNLRAKWMLAGVQLAKTPPDAAVEGLLAEILAANPKHEGAQRDRARLKRLAAVAAVATPGPH